MRHLRTLVLGMAFIAPILVPAFAGAGGGACAAAAGQPHAALVVDTGGQATTYCVALDASSVSGIHLIQLAGTQYGLAYQLGFGGQAVCRLNGVGPSGGDCFGDYPDYWGYWHGNGAGGWTWAGSGAASSTIGQGDVEGWVFGAGDSGVTHAAPPSLAFDDVCDSVPTPVPTSSPPPSPRPSPGANPSPGTGPGTGTGTGTGTGATSAPSASASASGGTDPSKTGQRNSPTPVSTPSDEGSSTPEIIRAVPTGGSSPSPTGPPVGAVAVAIAVAGLWVAGWLTLRRRRRDERA